VDTGNGEFVRPGVVAKVEGDTAEQIIQAVQKVKIRVVKGNVTCNVT
jgi:type III secretion system FlhB-like substrate exporter